MNIFGRRSLGGRRKSLQSPNFEKYAIWFLGIFLAVDISPISYLLGFSGVTKDSPTMNSVSCCGDQFKHKRFRTSLWKNLLHLLMAHVLRIYDPDDIEGAWSMVQTNGTQFMLNGQPFYVNGFNTYWLMAFAADESTRGKVTELFEQASALNLTVCRTWAFNDGQYRALQKSPSVYDEEVFKGLDFVISEARKYKIRVILSLVNNWEPYGGKSQYVKWGKDDGLNLSTCDDDFFSHPTIKSYYKAHVYTVLNRVNTVTNITYKDDPTIFAWELMNEPRCESDPSGDKLQNWIQEMAAYVKSIDPKHLVEIGLEGFYGPSTPNKVQCNPNTYSQLVGTDFIRNHQVLGVDFASIHIYPDWFSQPISDESIEFTESWMQSHIDDGENILGMPVLFSEFGVSTKDPGYNDTYRHNFITTVYRTILNSTKKGGSGGGSLLWQLFPEGTEYMDDGYAVFLPKKRSSIMNIISTHSTNLKVACSRKWGCNLLHHDEL